MDREVIARAARRREVLEELAFERERETALRAQLEAVVLEIEGPRLDREAQARLDPADRELLGDFFAGPEEGDAEDEEVLGVVDDTDDEDPAHEVERLAGEIARSQARQGALERLAGVLETPLAEGAAAEPGL